MSIRDNLRKAMYAKLLSDFPTEFGSSVIIGLENQKLDRPQDEAYMIAYFKHIHSKPASIGTSKRFNRHKGFFIVDCYVPEDSGTSKAWTMADAVATIFDGQHLTLSDGSYVTIETPQVVGKGHLDGSYYAVTMVPYIMDAAPKVI